MVAKYVLSGTDTPFEADVTAVGQQQEQTKEKIEYIRKRPNHHGRAKLPGHLPVEEIEIYPEGNLSDMVCIGKEVTEELECEPARFFIKRYIRYKYTTKNGEGVRIGLLPERVIDKGIPGAGLLASILVDKYVDHLPLYRQKQRFARENIQIASSTIEGWTKEALLKLEPLYDQLVFDTKSKGYLQVDETPIKVLDSDKKGAAHQGYYWVYLLIIIRMPPLILIKMPPLKITINHSFSKLSSWLYSEFCSSFFFGLPLFKG